VFVRSKKHPLDQRFLAVSVENPVVTLPRQLSFSSRHECLFFHVRSLKSRTFASLGACCLPCSPIPSCLDVNSTWRNCLSRDRPQSLKPSLRGRDRFVMTPLLFKFLGIFSCNNPTSPPRPSDIADFFFQTGRYPPCPCPFILSQPSDTTRK